MGLKGMFFELLSSTAPSNLGDCLRKLGYTVTLETTVTGTDTGGSTLTVINRFPEQKVSGNLMIATAIDSPTMAKALVRGILFCYSPSSIFANAYRNNGSYFTAAAADVDGFLENGKQYYIIVCKT